MPATMQTQRAFTSGARPSLARPVRATRAVCKAHKANELLEALGQKVAVAGAAAALSLGAMAPAPAMASEFDILSEPTPTSSYFIDDADVLSRSTRSEVNTRLKALEIGTGFRLEVATVRKLEFETDAFAFADKALGSWYKGSEGDNKGMLLVVSAGKEGALTGGAKFMEAIGDDLIDSIVSDNIPIYTEEEKYNQTVLSSLDRIEAKLNGKEVPAAPARKDDSRKRTYKTKAETDKSKNVTATVVGALLFIAVVVPMLQYYGYTAKD